MLPIPSPQIKMGGGGCTETGPQIMVRRVNSTRVRMGPCAQPGNARVEQAEHAASPGGSSQLTEKQVNDKKQQPQLGHGVLQILRRAKVRISEQRIFLKHCESSAKA